MIKKCTTNFPTVSINNDCLECRSDEKLSLRLTRTHTHLSRSSGFMVVVDASSLPHEFHASRARRVGTVNHWTTSELVFIRLFVEEVSNTFFGINY